MARTNVNKEKDPTRDLEKNFFSRSRSGGISCIQSLGASKFKHWTGQLSFGTVAANVMRMARVFTVNRARQ